MEKKELGIKLPGHIKEEFDRRSKEYTDRTGKEPRGHIGIGDKDKLELIFVWDDLDGFRYSITENMVKK